MIKQEASAYFQQLSELLRQTQVTEQKGASLSLNEGMSRAIEMTLSVGAAARKMMLIGNGGSAAIASHV